MNKNMDNIELAVVIPVYNEQDALKDVVKKWTDQLKRHKIPFELHLYNDGSIDNTRKILNKLEKTNPHLKVHNKQNSGHGPTILNGYNNNLDKEWIFQTDSDDEMSPEHFYKLWQKRNEFDFLLGERANRLQSFNRWTISAFSRLVVCFFYRKGIYDVNSPYRLMRSAAIKDLIDIIPKDTFAPNIIISGMVGLMKIRFLETPIPHQNRKTGEVSIKKWRLLKAVYGSFIQTIKFRLSKNTKLLLLKKRETTRERQTDL